MGFDSHFPRPRTSSSASYYDIIQMMREVANLLAGHVATGVSGWMDGYMDSRDSTLASISSEQLVENFLIHMTKFSALRKSMRITYTARVRFDKYSDVSQPCGNLVYGMG